MRALFSADALNWRDFAPQSGSAQSPVLRKDPLHFGPDEEAGIRREFDRWLETAESRTVGMIRKGESESVDRQPGRRRLTAGGS